MCEFNPHRLVVARAARNMTQQQLAESISDVQTAKGVSKWETGAVTPSLKQFSNICNALSVSPNFLMGLSSFAELDNPVKSELKKKYLTAAVGA